MPAVASDPKVSQASHHAPAMSRQSADRTAATQPFASLLDDVQSQPQAPANDPTSTPVTQGTAPPDKPAATGKSASASKPTASNTTADDDQSPAATNTPPAAPAATKPAAATPAVTVDATAPAGTEGAAKEATTPGKDDDKGQQPDANAAPIVAAPTPAIPVPAAPGPQQAAPAAAQQATPTVQAASQPTDSSAPAPQVTAAHFTLVPGKTQVTPMQGATVNSAKLPLQNPNKPGVQTPVATTDETSGAMGNAPGAPDPTNQPAAGEAKPAAAAAAAPAVESAVAHRAARSETGGDTASAAAPANTATIADAAQAAAAAQQPATAPASAPQATAATPATNPNAVAVPIQGVPVAIAAQAQNGNNSFSIRLDPPELGRIDVRLDVDRDGQVKSRLVVDRPETLDLLRRDAPQLERALQDAGLKTSDNGLQFSLRDQSQSWNGGGNDRQSAPTATATMFANDDTLPSPEVTQRSYASLAASRGGVDIRI